MEPMTMMAVAGGIAATTAIVQWYNSEQGRKASASERQQIKRMLENVQSPNFDPRQITPEQFKVVSKYVPKAAAFVAEQAPQVIQAKSEGAIAGRDATMNALNRLKNLANTGTDEESNLLQQEATNATNIANRGRQGAITESFQNRGAGGSGLELLAQMSNAQNANDMQAQSSRQGRMRAVQTRLQALRDSADIGSRVRGEAIDIESRNNDVWNGFNQRTSQRQQQYGEMVAGLDNDAQRFNVGNEQDIANRNTGATNDFNRFNQTRDDRNQQSAFDNEMAKVGQFSGVANTARQDIQNSTRDTNSAIAGAGDAGQSILAYDQQERRRKEDRGFEADERQKDRDANMMRYENRQAIGSNSPLNRQYGRQS